MKTDPGLSATLLQMARDGGADGAEVYQSAFRMLSAEARAKELDAVENAVSYGYGVRVIVSGRPGFSYATEINEARNVVAAAIENSRHAEYDEHTGFPLPDASRELKTFDAEIDEIKEADAISMAIKMESAALDEDKRIARTRKAHAAFYVSDVNIANTNGLSLGYRATQVITHIMAVAEEGQDGQMGWAFRSSRHLSDVDFAEVGREAAKKATAMLGAKRISALRAPIMLDNHVAAEFLGVFSSMLSSENVQKGKSLLAGKLGQQVVSDLVDIVDDGTAMHAPGMRPIDDEGTVARRNELVQNGTLRSYMYNTRTGSKEGRASTGNAVRGRYSSVPGVGPLCLSIDTKGEKYSPEGILSRMDSGLYITDTMGMHTANPVSGEFSIGVSGMWVEHGKPVHPVKEAAISGNVLELFGRVLCVGDDIMYFGSIGSPSLLMGPTDISA